jgi:hypothetical protein
MGRHKHEYSDSEIAQLKMELYCQACDLSFYKDGWKRGKMSQCLDKHRESKRHKTNVEKHRIELEQEFKDIMDDKISINDANSKLDIDDSRSMKLEPFMDICNDDHMTSISSIINKNQDLEKRVNNMSDTSSTLLSNYNEMDSRTRNMCDILNKLKLESMEQAKDNAELRNQIISLKDEIRKNFKKQVTFNDISSGNIEIELMKYLSIQGVIISSNNEITENILSELKNNCKILINISNKGILSTHFKIQNMLVKQYELLNNPNIYDINNNKMDLIKLRKDIWDICGNSL